MKHFKTLSGAILLLLFIAGCGQYSFQRTKSGVMYKIIDSDKKNKQLQHGQILRFDFVYKVRDSVIMSSYSIGFPGYYTLDTNNALPTYSDAEVFPSLRQGDSAVIVMEADSLIKQGQQMPAFIKAKDKIHLYIKVRNIFNGWADLPVQEGFKRTSTGLLYKVISSGTGSQVKHDQVIRFQYRQSLNDSLLASSDDGGQAFEMVDTANKADYNIGEVFPLLRSNDSLVVIYEPEIIRVKSRGMPPNFKASDKIILGIRVTAVYENDALSKKDRDAESARVKKLNDEKMALQNQKDYGLLNDYITKNKIKVSRAPKGTLVEITQPGEGPLCLPGKVAMVLYTGKLMDGTSFDSNVDPAFNHAGQPYPVEIGKAGVIQGWDDGLRLFRKGGKGRLLIPSSLGYGKQGSPPSIGPNQNLIFDVEIVNVLDSMPNMGGGPGMQ